MIVLTLTVEQAKHCAWLLLLPFLPLWLLWVAGFGAYEEFRRWHSEYRRLGMRR